MPLSHEDRRHILINVQIEQERMFTVLGHLCSSDPEKAGFLAEIETILKDCLKRLEGTENPQSCGVDNTC